MSIEILRYPNPSLKKISEPIEKIDEGLRLLAKDMCRIMYSQIGLGLAAPQIGHLVRMVIVDTDWHSEGAKQSPSVMVNPKIVSATGKIKTIEGCLSIPDYSAEVERANQVVVCYTNLDGQEVTEEAEGLRAVCFQHEIDHLDGILFIDRISRLKRSMYVKRRKKQLRQQRGT